MNQKNILNLDSNKAKRFTLKNHFYLIQQFCPKKSILFVLLVFQFHCLTVYTKDETILEEKFIETKNSKEEKNNYNITRIKFWSFSWNSVFTLIGIGIIPL